MFPLCNSIAIAYMKAAMFNYLPVGCIKIAAARGKKNQYFRFFLNFLHVIRKLSILNFKSRGGKAWRDIY